MRVYISVDMEGIAGINHPHPTDPNDTPLPDVGRPDGRRDERGHRGRAGGRRDRHPRQRQPLEHVQPAAGRPPPARPRPPGPEGVVDGRRRAAGRRRRRRRSMSPCSSATTPGPGTRAGRSPTPTRATRSRRACDGRPTGEYGLNALVLGAWGIPVGLVAGDDALAEEVADWLPWAERVVVKDADGGAQRGVAPSDGRARARPRGRRAGRARGPRPASCGRSRSGGRSSSRSTYARGVIADHAAIVPGAERVGDRTVRFAHGRPGDGVPRVPASIGSRLRRVAVSG